MADYSQFNDNELLEALKAEITANLFTWLGHPANSKKVLSRLDNGEILKFNKRQLILDLLKCKACFVLDINRNIPTMISRQTVLQNAVSNTLKYSIRTDVSPNKQPVLVFTNPLSN